MRGGAEEVPLEHSTLKLPSQVSETPNQQQEEDEGDCKSIIHTAIREKVHDNTYFHPECIGVTTQTDKWKFPTCTEAL